VRSGLTWRLVALLICAAAVGHEYAVSAMAAGDPAYLAYYRVAIVTVAAVAFTLMALPERRVTYLLGFLACAGLIGYALYLQYVEYLDPCPLCLFQRVAMIALGAVFLVAAIHNPGLTGARVYAALATVAGATGAALAARHIWIQNLTAGKVPACGMGVEYMLETMPLFDVIKKVLSGSGECAAKGWELLHLTIPGWTFVFFTAMSVAAIAVAVRNR